MRTSVFFLMSMALVTGCSSLTPSGRWPSGDAKLTPKQIEVQTYNTLFPYYAQVCTTSQYVRRSGKFDAQGDEILERGGNGGHATIYLKGACLDDSKGFPQLKICDEEVDLTHHDAGVGVSVNKIFQNVNWVAIPGREMFYHGGLAEDETLTVAAYEEVIKNVSESEWFNGIKIDESVLKKYTDKFNMSVAELKQPENKRLYHEIIVRESIGTDFALSFARSSLCTRIPLPKKRFAEMIAFMNERNQESMKEGYAWDGIYDNCSHLTSNAFAATGIFDFKKTHDKHGNPIINKLKIAGVVLKSAFQALFQRMPDMSVPANNVVRLAEAAFERDIRNPTKAYDDKNNRATLSEDEPWLPTSHGALLEWVGIRGAERNEMFVEGKDPIILGTFFVKPLKKKYLKYKDFEDPENKRYYDLETNLKYHSHKYKKILESKKSPDEQYVQEFRLRLRDRQHQQFYDRKYLPVYRAFHANFYNTIEDLNKDVDEKLSRLP